MLSQCEIEAFIAEGYVAVRGAMPAGVAQACQDVIWSELGLARRARGGPVDVGPPRWCGSTAPRAARSPRPGPARGYGKPVISCWGRGAGASGRASAARSRSGSPAWTTRVMPGGTSRRATPRTGSPWVNIPVAVPRAARALPADGRGRGQRAHPPAPRVAPGPRRGCSRRPGTTGKNGPGWRRRRPPRRPPSTGRTMVATGHAGDVFLCHPFLVHAAKAGRTGAGSPGCWPSRPSSC